MRKNDARRNDSGCGDTGSAQFDEARQALSELEARRTRLMSDQDRVRQNLSAVGSSSDLGRDYMRRMTALDSDIDALNGEINKAGVQVKSSQKELDDYIAGLKL